MQAQNRTQVLVEQRTRVLIISGMLLTNKALVIFFIHFYEHNTIARTLTSLEMLINCGVIKYNFT
jgi:hypothetical protein